MDRAYIEENNVIRRYLRDQLNSEDSEAFEIYLVENPNMVDQLELDQIMVDGFKLQGNLGESDASGLINSLMNAISRPVPIYAPALMFIALLPFFYLSQNIGVPQSEVTLVNYSTETVRGNAAGPDNRITSRLVEPKTTSDSMAVLIKLQPRTVKTYLEFLVILSDGDTHNPLWESQKFEPTALRDKLIVIPHDLTLSNTRLEVFAIDDKGDRIPVNFCHYSKVCRDPL
ncbi:MAG: hypothetical protein ACJAYN_000790 [Bermanella sp.]|jgi:hypothetical protein